MSTKQFAVRLGTSPSQKRLRGTCREKDGQGSPSPLDHVITASLSGRDQWEPGGISYTASFGADFQKLVFQVCLPVVMKVLDLLSGLPTITV